MWHKALKVEKYNDKEKIKCYFSWLKKYNHLYEDYDFDINLIEEFENESAEVSKKFEENTKTGLNASEDSDDDLSIPEKSDGEEEDIFKKYNIEVHQPIAENLKKQDYTSMFFNKYCEDTNVPSVANKFANVVVDYEMNKNILIN